MVDGALNCKLKSTFFPSQFAFVSELYPSNRKPRNTPSTAYLDYGAGMTGLMKRNSPGEQENKIAAPWCVLVQKKPGVCRVRETA